MAAGILFVVLAAVTKAEAYVYLWGVFFGEWGGMILVNGLVSPGIPRIGVSVFFSLAMGSTAFLLWKLRRESQDRNTIPPEGGSKATSG